MTERIEPNVVVEQNISVAEFSQPLPQPETVAVFDIPRGNRKIEAQLAAMAFGFM